MAQAFECDICHTLKAGQPDYKISLSSSGKKINGGVKTYETCTKCFTKVNTVLK